MIRVAQIIVLYSLVAVVTRTALLKLDLLRSDFETWDNRPEKAIVWGALWPITILRMSAAKLTRYVIRRLQVRRDRIVLPDDRSKGVYR